MRYTAALSIPFFILPALSLPISARDAALDSAVPDSAVEQNFPLMFSRNADTTKAARSEVNPTDEEQWAEITAKSEEINKKTKRSAVTNPNAEDQWRSLIGRRAAPLTNEERWRSLIGRSAEEEEEISDEELAKLLGRRSNDDEEFSDEELAKLLGRRSDEEEEISDEELAKLLGRSPATDDQWKQIIAENRVAVDAKVKRDVNANDEAWRSLVQRSTETAPVLAARSISPENEAAWRKLAGRSLQEEDNELESDDTDDNTDDAEVDDDDNADDNANLDNPDLVDRRSISANDEEAWRKLVGRSIGKTANVARSSVPVSSDELAWRNLASQSAGQNANVARRAASTSSVEQEWRRLAGRSAQENDDENDDEALEGQDLVDRSVAPKTATWNQIFQREIEGEALE